MFALATVSTSRAYVREGGFWVRAGWLDMPDKPGGGEAFARAMFGSSLAIERRTAEFAIVSAPGVSKAYFFRRSYNSGTHVSTWSWTTTLTPSASTL